MNAIRTRRGRAAAGSAVALAALLTLAMAGPAAALTPPTVPANLAVPPGHELYLVGHARGFQIYTCQPQDGGYAWVLLQPWAILVDDSGGSWPSTTRDRRGQAPTAAP
jgi:hypothetical protein